MLEFIKTVARGVVAAVCIVAPVLLIALAVHLISGLSYGQCAGLTLMLIILAGAVLGILWMLGMAFEGAWSDFVWWRWERRQEQYRMEKEKRK